MYLIHTTQVAQKWVTGGNGGIVGFLADTAGCYPYTEITNCYNRGIVDEATQYNSLPTHGGILGFNRGGGHKIENSYWLYDSNASSPFSKVTNGVGNEASATGVTSKSVTELKELANSLGTVYMTDNNNKNEGYPILIWQNS